MGEIHTSMRVLESFAVFIPYLVQLPNSCKTLLDSTDICVSRQCLFFMSLLYCFFNLRSILTICRDEFDADFLASMRHSLRGLSEQQDIAGASTVHLPESQQVLDSQQSDLPVDGNPSVPAICVDFAADDFISRIPHWASRVFDQSCPMSKIDSPHPSRFLAQPDPGALQRLISGGFAEILQLKADLDAKIRFYYRVSDHAAHILISQKGSGSSTVVYYSKPLVDLRFVQEDAGVSLKYRDLLVSQETWAFIRCSVCERMIILMHTMCALKAQSLNFVPDTDRKVKDITISPNETTLFSGELEEAHGRSHVLRVISKTSGSQPRIDIVATSGAMKDRVILCAFIEWEVLSRSWAQEVNDYKVRVSVLRPHVFVPLSWHMSPGEGPFEFTFTSEIAGAMIASLDYIRGGQLATTRDRHEPQGRTTTAEQPAIVPTGSQLEEPHQQTAVMGLLPQDREKILTIKDIPTIEQLHNQRYFRVPSHTAAQASAYLNKKVSIVVHDITKLQVDAIVNSAHYDLIPSGPRTTSIAISSAAGPQLREDLREIGWCDIGSAVTTPAYRLPCKIVIHAVGPTGKPDAEKDQAMRDTYLAALQLAVQNKARTIAFPSIATGYHSYPERLSARIAVATVRQFLTGPQGYLIDKVVFCLFSEKSRIAYEGAIP